MALFRNNTWARGGTLEFTFGPTFRATTNFWSTKFEFRDDGDQRLLGLNYGGVFHLSARVEVERKAMSLPGFQSWYS